MHRRQEGDRPHAHQHQRRDNGFEAFRAAEARPVDRQRPQEGRDDDDAHGITRPPDEPAAGEAVRRDRVRREQGERPDRGADRHAHQRAEEHERERVPDTLQARAEVDAHQQRGGDDRCERVADRDPRRRRQRVTERCIHREGGDRDGGPHPPAVREARDERDAGRRPQRCDRALDE